jgi:14-3-3 protein epsilon
MAMTEVRDLAAAARAALADGRVLDALTCYASATRSARTQLPPHAPERIALAAEHAQVVFDHRSDPESALEIATTAYDEAVDGIDDAGEHAAAVRELALLRDRMTFWAFGMGD